MKKEHLIMEDESFGTKKEGMDLCHLDPQEMKQAVLELKELESKLQKSLKAMGMYMYFM